MNIFSVRALIATVCCSALPIAANCGGTEPHAATVAPAGDESGSTTATSASSAPTATAASASTAATAEPRVTEVTPHTVDVIVYDPSKPSLPARDATKDKHYLDLIFSMPGFPKKFLSAPKLCPAKSGGTLESRWQRGLFVPRVVSASKGSFTAPKADETLVVASLEECNGGLQASHQFAVLQGDTVVVSINSTATRFADAGIGIGTGAVVDVDVDGQSEIVITADSFLFGTGILQTATLVRFDTGKLVTVQDLGLVMTNSCAFPSKTMTYSVVHASIQAGGKPTFVLRDATGFCE